MTVDRDLLKAVGRGVGTGALVLVLGGAAWPWLSGQSASPGEWSATAAIALPEGVRPAPPPPTPAKAVAADFGETQPGDATRRLADSILRTGDNRGVAFVIVDKSTAQLYLFDGVGRLRAETPVLLGAAIGDESVPGIGDRPLALVKPEERTTPAGRFLAERGYNLTGEKVVWIDYEAAVSMHAVRSGNPAERRMERLASPSPEDNRISYGCINIPRAFFHAHIVPLFERYRTFVYVLPDEQPLEVVFAPLFENERVSRRRSPQDPLLLSKPIIAAGQGLAPRELN